MNEPLIFELEIGEAWTEVSVVSFVDRPAIERDFFKFRGENPFRFSKSEALRIVTGPVLIPDLVIHRKIENTLFNVVFRADQVSLAYEKFVSSGSFNSTNILHSSDLPASDMSFMYETFLTDKARGIMAPKGFEDLPDKTWFMSYKITGDALWKEIELGNIRGFSIEGRFKMKPIGDLDIDQEIAELEELIRKNS